MKKQYSTIPGVKKNKRKVRYKRRKVKRTKLQKNILKTLLFIVVLTVALVLAARTSLFNIDSINVIGNTRYNEEQIIKTSGITVGENGFIKMGINPVDIFTLSFGKSQQSISKTYPYIKNVSVRYSIPNKINIYIVERKPACIVDVKGVGILVDSEMYALDVAKKGENYDMPKLYGLKFAKFLFGDALKVSNPETIKLLKSLTDSIDKSDLNDKLKINKLITSINLQDINNIKITLKPQITVNFGDLNDLEYKITYLKKIFEEYIIENERGYLDFSTGDNPVFEVK